MDPELKRRIQDLIAYRGGGHNEENVADIIENALKLLTDVEHTGDVRVIQTALRELRYAFKLFAPYAETRKVTMFGSARTQASKQEYSQAVDFGRKIAQAGFMVITGAGGGIMQAGHEGAGPEMSFGANIRLPWEQAANPVIREDNKLVTFKYFFTRKLMFIRHSDALALFPGGFGTLDEALETLTLVQTGKNPPIPLVLIDYDDGGYWEPWFEFLRDTLLTRGLISGEDFGLFTITRDPFEAAQVINDFYRVYHSSRFIGKTLVIRLNKSLSAEQVATLQAEFAEIVEPGSKLAMTAAFPEEGDQPDLLDLPRLAFAFDRRSFGLLEAFIRRLNSF